MLTDLALFKRHNCGQADKFFFECPCPIWITGRLPDGQLVPRQSTGHSDKAGAEAIKADLIDRFTKGSEVRGLTIHEALTEYLASLNGELSAAVEDQYRLIIGRLIRFCADRKAHYMPQLTVDLVDSFGSAGFANKASTTRAVCMAKVAAFLADAFRRGWIEEPLAVRMKAVRGIYEEKTPYTDEEVKLILDGCASMHAGSRGSGYGSQPATFRLLLELMLMTGMRVGDAIRFDPSILSRSNNLWMYRFLQQKRAKTKQIKYLDVHITEQLKTNIERATWLSTRLPFKWGQFKRASYLANEVYLRMQAIGERVGVEDCRPHRLRDTFAVRCLLRGLTLDDVKVLLGHSSVKVTEKYYARWVPARSALLENKLSAILD